MSGGDVLCRMIGHHPFMSGQQIDELGEAEHLALAVLILHNDAGALEVNHDYGGDVAIVPGELRAARSGTRPWDRLRRDRHPFGGRPGHCIALRREQRDGAGIRSIGRTGPTQCGPS